jgi:hypothetical protein
MHDILEHPFVPYGTPLEEFSAVGALLYIRLPTWDVYTREGWASGLADDLLKTLLLHGDSGATLRRRRNPTPLIDPTAEQFLAQLELEWGRKCGSVLQVYRADEAFVLMSAGRFPEIVSLSRRSQVARDFFRERIAPLLRAGYRYARHRYAGYKRELVGKTFNRGVDALTSAATKFDSARLVWDPPGMFEITLNLKYAHVRVKRLYGRSE